MTPEQVKAAASLLSQIETHAERRARIANELGGDRDLYVRPAAHAGVALSLAESRAVVAALVAHSDKQISEARAALAALGVHDGEGAQGNG